MKALQKAFDVLELIASTEERVSLKQVAEARQLPMPTALRILNVLEERGYVVRDPVSRKYGPGLRLWELGCAAVNRQNLVETARPILEHLVRVTGETASLATYDRGEIVYLDKINSPQPIAMTLNLGERAPAYCVGVGKVVLAWGPEEELARVLRKGLRRFTARTVTTEREFRRELARIRAQGYATNTGEYRDGVSGVAAPVFDHDGRAMFALGVAGPTTRFTREKVRRIAAELKAASAELSRRLYAISGTRYAGPPV